MVRQQAAAERDRTRLRRLAKPASYLVVSAVVAYLLVLIGMVLAAPALLMGMVFAGISAVLGVVVGIGVAIYAYSGNVAETYRTIRENPASESAD